jgi:hypothetical protein
VKENFVSHATTYRTAGAPGHRATFIFYFFLTRPSLPPYLPTVYRARDLSTNADTVEKGVLSREVEYARTTSALYAIVLKEAQGVKGDIVSLSKSVEGLAGGISNSRIIAARLAEVE